MTSSYLDFVRGTLEIMVRKGKMTQAEAEMVMQQWSEVNDD